MNIVFTPIAWAQYMEWQAKDKRIVRKINDLIQDIQRHGFTEGIGKPEALRHRKAWSRRIDQANRLVYIGDERQNLFIIACKGHYEE